MKSVGSLVLLGLALAVLCEGVSMEAEVAMIEVAPASALQAAEKKMAQEGFDLKGLLAVPSKPDNMRVYKELEDMSKGSCKSTCGAVKKCAGFEYRPGEKLCRLFVARKPDPKISLKTANKKMKAAVKEAVKRSKEKDKKKRKAALKAQQKAMAPVRKDPSAGQRFREADKKLGLRQKAYFNAKKAAKEAAKKSKGARAAEVITKAHEHKEMMEELAAAKDAQAASLNFEEQLIMAVSPSSKNVLIAGAHKKAAVVAEDKADKEFQKAKRVMKSAIKLQLKMKETKVKAVEKLVATKAAAKKAEAKHKAAGRLYKAQERKEKNAQDEQKEKTAAKARMYLKQQNKKAERINKARAAAKSSSKESKLKKCHKAQIKMRQMKYKLKRRLKKQVYARQRKVADKQVERLKKGLKKEELRKAELAKQKAANGAEESMRERFDLSKEEAASLMSQADELGESATAPSKAAIKAEAAEVQKANMKAEKAAVTANFKKKEQVDLQNAAAKKSKEVSAKSEEVNALNLDLAGAKGNTKKQNAIKAKIAALKPALQKAQVDLKQTEDKVVELKNAANDAARKAKDATKNAARGKAQLARNEDSADAAKVAAQAAKEEAAKKSREEEFAIKKKMIAREAKETDKIRKHSRAKARSIIAVKWAEMKRTLKLKPVHCEPKQETEVARLKKKLKSLTDTLGKLKRSRSKAKDKKAAKKAVEASAKTQAKSDAAVKEKEDERAFEVKEKAKVKAVQATANKEVAAAKADEAKEKTIAKANEKKADVAKAEAKAEAEKLKSEEQASAAKKVAPKGL